MESRLTLWRNIHIRTHIYITYICSDHNWNLKGWFKCHEMFSHMLQWALFWKNRDRKQHRFAFLLYVSKTTTGNQWPVVPSWRPDHFPALLGNLNDQKQLATKLATVFLAFDGMLAITPICFRNKVICKVFQLLSCNISSVKYFVCLWLHHFNEGTPLILNKYCDWL